MFDIGILLLQNGRLDYCNSPIAFLCQRMARNSKPKAVDKLTCVLGWALKESNVGLNSLISRLQFMLEPVTTGDWKTTSR